MAAEHKQQFEAAFHAAFASLERLQRAAIKNRSAATYAEAQHAVHRLIDALEFDFTEGHQVQRPRGGRA